MRTALLLLALLAAPAFAGQTVWKWVDEKGVTHYADRPVPGAERIDLTVTSRADSVATPPPAATASRPQQAPATSYRNFEIWQPGDQDTVANTGGVVEVRLRFEPSLQPGHSLYLYLDGRLIEGLSTTAQDFTLRDVPRGLHTLVAVIQDDRGTRIAETAPVRFTVRQESIAQPPVGPTLRTPPKTRAQQTGNKLPRSQPSYATLNGAQPRINPRTNLPVRP